jgi:glucose-6-phosphate isomerase
MSEALGDAGGFLADVESAGGLTVHGAASVAEAAEQRAALAQADIPARLAGKDPALWGPEAEQEASIRLGWVDTFTRSRDLLPRLAEIRAEIGDLDRVVLAGMGGSSLAPEVIAKTLDRPLVVLDSTDPGQVRAAMYGSGGDTKETLLRTVVVVSSKSGSTVETDSQRRAYWQAFRDAGLSEAETGRHFVVVTDPGSPLEQTAREMGAYVVLADPDVGGRYSALTAFGVVPSALAGVDVVELLDQAQELAASLPQREDNPSLALGAALGAAALHGRPNVALVDDGTGISGLGDWAEQLIAESTGKQGTGILPVVVESPDAPGATGEDVLTVSVGGAAHPGDVPGGGLRPDVAVQGPLGAQFLAWEYATAIAGRLLGINPFDQPNVAESKDNTKKILASGMPSESPSFTEGAVQVFGAPGGTGNLAGALRGLLDGLDPAGYLAVTAYLDRFADSSAAALRPALARLTSRPVTFGWGPRFLHSTGQYHKGGPQVASFLQITGAVAEDLAVPGESYSFGTLQAAQAAGDRQALGSRGRTVLRLHLTDRAKGLAQLLAVAETLP